MARYPFTFPADGVDAADFKKALDHIGCRCKPRGNSPVRLDAIVSRRNETLFHIGPATTFRRFQQPKG